MLGVLLAVQMTVGEVQYRIDMSWWLVVLIHVALLAATLWAVLTDLVASLWRPVLRGLM